MLSVAVGVDLFSLFLVAEFLCPAKQNAHRIETVVQLNFARKRFFSALPFAPIDSQQKVLHPEPWYLQTSWHFPPGSRNGTGWLWSAN
jgi:hypothetical protein